MRQLRKCSHVAAFLHHDKAQKTDLKPLRLVKKWMKSSITIAASSVCKHEILMDRLNKIQWRTVWCSIFCFFSKQTMNLLFHCTFAWICVDFSCKTAFISYHVMSATECTRKACKSLAFGSWFTSFSPVLPTSRVAYHAGKPIESVVYCLNRPWK